jgi:glucan endo-1,3-beta-D-glucosidase
MQITSALAALAAFPSARAVHQGFNYGAFFTDGSPKLQSDFEAEFKTAQNLEGAPGTFNSARLYTMIVSQSYPNNINIHQPPPPLSPHLQLPA